MKSQMWRLGLLAAFAGLLWLGWAMPAAAAEERVAIGDRLERLERQVGELAQRQEQMMHRIEMQMQRREGMPQPLPDDLRRPAPPMGGAPAAALHGPPGEKAAKGLHDLIGLLFFIGFICNILLAVWIFTDIRRRGEGSGIFVAMALVAGIPAALIYSLTRIGDKKA